MLLVSRCVLVRYVNLTFLYPLKIVHITKKLSLQSPQNKNINKNYHDPGPINELCYFKVNKLFKLKIKNIT